jgi:hypothetical protein
MTSSAKRCQSLGGPERIDGFGPCGQGSVNLKAGGAGRGGEHPVTVSMHLHYTNKDVTRFSVLLCFWRFAMPH